MHCGELDVDDLRNNLVVQESPENLLERIKYFNSEKFSQPKLPTENTVKHALNSILKRIGCVSDHFL
jgi:hypothetical protein